MASFIPKFIQDIPGVILRAMGGPHVPEQEKPVLSVKAKILLAVVAATISIALLLCIPQGTPAIRALSIYSFGLSAFLWFAAGTIPTPLPLAYASSPPKKIISRVKWQSWCNQAGAVFTAVGLILQYIPIATVP